MGQLNVMDPSGDSRIMWNPQNDAEVAAAKATFDALRSKGYFAYRVKPGGEKGEVIREFDPKAEKIILAPQMAGGCS